MNFIKKIFGQEDKLTPQQFYFPYFFDEFLFRNLISPFNLTTEVKFDEKTKIASELYLKEDGEIKLIIKFGQQLMVENGSLTIWSTNQDKLIIEKFDLELKAHPKILEIIISKLEIGVNLIENNLELTNFITYIRSANIKYKQDFYETYGIIIIKNNSVELIPFDWFNKKGGDYGYVWPALAQLDSHENLIGIGMRMEKFKIGIRKKAYNNVYSA